MHKFHLRFFHSYKMSKFQESFEKAREREREIIAKETLCNVE